MTNNVGCGYDGGDCCEYTHGVQFGCDFDGFDCLDPIASTDGHLTPSPFYSLYSTYGSSARYAVFIGDRYFDTSNNNEECDHGD